MTSFTFNSTYFRAQQAEKVCVCNCFYESCSCFLCSCFNDATLGLKGGVFSPNTELFWSRIDRSRFDTFWDLFQNFVINESDPFAFERLPSNRRALKRKVI